MDAVATKRPVSAAARFFPVALDSIDSALLSMDLYIRVGTADEPVLYRSTGVAFDDADRERLTEQGHEFLYVPLAQHAAFRRQLASRLDHLYHDPHQRRSERTRMVRTACARMIEDVLSFPGQPEMYATVAEISRTFARWSYEDPELFGHLVDLSSHDYYTATHMVNVGANCGVLARALGISDPEAQAPLILGGLLHDVGKRGVPVEILNKEGKLTPDEWKVLARHPETGAEELRAVPGVPAVVVDMAYCHHERLDGTGYPRRLMDPQISLAARICAVADVFDAISATRPYRGPIAPDQVLEMMAAGVPNHFDRDVFAVWSQVVRGMVARDPDRAASTGDLAGRPIALRAFLPETTVVPNRATPCDRSRPLLVDSERRRHRRTPCGISLRIQFIRRGKADGPDLRDWVAVRAIDISPGGLQLETPWPLSRNDLLVLELAQPGGRTLFRKGRVVRVRAGGGGTWRAGVEFVTAE